MSRLIVVSNRVNPPDGGADAFDSANNGAGVRVQERISV